MSATVTDHVSQITPAWQHEPGPHADPATVQALIEGFAALSEPNSEPGVTRLCYTALERDAHRVFSSHMRSLGLSVHTDAAGNTIAERPGTEAGLPALGTGSHLDSVPHAGAFDGIAGVVAGMEIARQLVEHDITHRHPIRFVAFAAEEGARFGQACTGSRIVAGMTTAEDTTRFADKNGTTLAEAMREVGLDPDRIDEARWSSADWAAFVELHIEQGAVLDSLGVQIGVVDLISGSTRLRIDLHGRAAHTGGTPMHLRRDALVAAAEVVLAAETLANDDRHRGTRITVGRLDVEPGSITTIPGECSLHLDIRDVDSARQRATADELLATARAIAAARGIGIDVRLLADTSPVVLSRRIRTAITDAAAAHGLPYRVMPSGASHDSQTISRVCPVGMVFVPSLNHGVSHSPDELTTFTDLATGTDVLLDALLRLDHQLHAGGTGSSDAPSTSSPADGAPPKENS
jgi:hydantoinase/carbamoylase family amidase